MGKKKKFHSTKSIVDFADERIVSFEELEPEERIYCSMLSNLILGGDVYKRQLSPTATMRARRMDT